MPGTVVLNGERIGYVLRVSARAHRMRLVVRPGTGLEVVVPRGVARAVYEAFIHEKGVWILATLARVAREASVSPSIPLVDGARLPYAGRDLLLALRTGAASSRHVAALSGDTLTLTVPEGRQDLARLALARWYRSQAEIVFAERLHVCNQRYGFTVRRVSIREQKSRWGSCSKLGNLSFNWRLLLAPLPVLDYVVIHELCHLKELNHGPRFWKLVALACPDHAVHRRWLRQHGRELTF